VPFQRSASGKITLPFLWQPTAVQAVADVHDTPIRVLSTMQTGTGGTVFQLVPSQDSANAK
jgi:hypothetical protein